MVQKRGYNYVLRAQHVKGVEENNMENPSKVIQKK